MYNVSRWRLCTCVCYFFDSGPKLVDVTNFWFDFFCVWFIVVVSVISVCGAIIGVVSVSFILVFDSELL